MAGKVAFTYLQPCLSLLCADSFSMPVGLLVFLQEPCVSLVFLLYTLADIRTQWSRLERVTHGYAGIDLGGLLD